MKKKRSLSHFAYYAANRAFPVFCCSCFCSDSPPARRKKAPKRSIIPPCSGETKDEVLAALDAENLTYKEDDLYANAYVLDGPKRSKTVIFRSTCFSISTPIRFTATAGSYSSKTRPMRTASCPKLLNTLTAQYGEPTTYPALKTASPRTSTA